MQRSYVGIAFLLCWFPSITFAQDITSDILAKGAYVSFDGLLDEWEGLPGQTVPIIQKVSYNGSEDLSVFVQSLHDAEFLYFAITVTDDQFRRTGSNTLGEDKIILWFGADATGQKPPLSLSFLPGDLHSIKQDLRFQGKKVTRSRTKTFEALESFVPKEGRWMAEFSIPWKKLPVSLLGREKIPFCLSVFDGDVKNRPRVETIASTCTLKKGVPNKLGVLFLQEKAQIFEGFLQDIQYKRSDLNQEFYADVAGDKEIEQIVFVGPYLAILGTGLGENHYYYYRLNILSSEDITNVRLLDVDGDGKKNLIVHTIEYDTTQKYKHEIVRVFQLSNAGLTPLWGHEIANWQPEGSLLSTIDWKKRGKRYEVTISSAMAKGVQEENYMDLDREDLKDYKEILLPWGTEKRVRYRFVSGKAEKF